MKKRSRRSRTECERVAEGVERLIQRFGVDSFRRPLMRYLNEWTKPVQAFLEQDRKFGADRENFFRSIDQGRRENPGNTPPAKGWSLEPVEVRSHSGERDCFDAWVPPHLSLTSRPELAPDVFDPSQGRRASSDKYVILALIHAAALGHNGVPIFPKDFEPEDKESFHESLVYAHLLDMAKDVVQRERRFGELRFPLREWLADVKVECERADPPPDLGGRPPTPIQEDLDLLKRFDEGKFDGKWTTQEEFAREVQMSPTRLSERLRRARDFGKRSGNP